MKTTFAAAIQLCGLSQPQAAEFLGVRLDTVKSWGAGRNPAPGGAWEMLAELWRRIESAADNASMNEAISSPASYHHLAADDMDGLPGGADEAAGAMALLIALATGKGGA